MTKFATRDAPSDMRCPTCGAPAEPGQLVCLECGSRIALAYRRPPDWKLPAAIVAVVLLLALVTTAVALNRVGNEAEREVGATPIKVRQPPAKDRASTTGEKAPAAGEKASTAEEKPAAEKTTPEKEPAPEEPSAEAPATGTGLVQRGVLWSWPRELKGFTVVLLSAEDRASAERFARSASEGKPAKIGVIRADDFESLPKGFYVVFAGQYEDRATAERATARLGERFSGAFPQAVTP